jgi:outer membrane biosynthesis protein TonB
MNKKLISKKKEPKRKVYVGFVVHEDGTTSDFNIDKGLGNPYDNEALRLIRDNPQAWVAGQCGKKKVKTRMTMPVEF